jgi:hypothetical protein
LPVIVPPCPIGLFETTLAWRKGAPPQLLAFWKVSGPANRCPSFGLSSPFPR